MIKANFSAYNAYVTDSLYQYDKDQTLEVAGINIAVAPEIHFTNSDMGRAIVRQGVLKNGIITVKIPNSMLQSTSDIKVYVGVWEGSTFKTLESIIIPIIPKDKPLDYILENNDEEYYSFSKLENDIANMITLSKHNADVDVLKKQIANIIAHNNDVSSNTELIDLRTDINGIKYPSAGESLRAQVKELSEEIAKLRVTNDFVFENIDCLNMDGFINKQGSVTSGTGECSDFIKVKRGDEFYICTIQDYNDSYSVGLYDADKKFIRGVTCPAGDSYLPCYQTHIVTDECYLRFSSVNTKPKGFVCRKTNVSNQKVLERIESKLGDTGVKTDDITDRVMKNKMEDSYINDKGELVSNAPLCCASDFIKVNEGDTYRYNIYVLYNNNSACFAYDVNKQMIKSFGKKAGWNDDIITITKGIAYIRFSTTDNRKNNRIYKVIDKSIMENLMLLKSDLNEKSVIIPNDYQELDVVLTGGYLTSNNSIVAHEQFMTTDYISLNEYPLFIVNTSYGWDCVAYALYDINKDMIFSRKSATGVFEQITLNVNDVLTQYPNAKYVRFSGTIHEPLMKLKIFVPVKNNIIDKALDKVIRNGNILYGKKIAFCGDSFTEANNLGIAKYSYLDRCYKSFGWRIANRNHMRLYHDGLSGSTMRIIDPVNTNKNNPFAYERYKRVPKDVDYIILQFGLNESNSADDPTTLGTKDSTDVTTMWGSYNTVLKYLITNCPTAKIGLICSDAWIPQKYYEALKSIAEWWGIPLLDLGGDPNVSLMNSGRRNGAGLELNPEVAKLRNNTFYTNVSTNDSHPNDAGHEWRSTVIEHWIRGL